MANTPVTRRPLRELRTLYEVQPQIRDVIVEGRSDAQLIQWYLNERNLAAVAHAVDDRVEITSDLVVRHGGEVGPRGRVIGLAYQIDEWDLAETTVTCIIDSDRDALLENRPTPPSCLLATDLGTMDVYLLQSRPFSKFLRIILGRTDDPNVLREKLLPALNELCVVRAVLHWSGLGISLVRDFASCCQFTATGVVVDTPELLNRTLSGRDREHYEELLKEVERMRALIPTERLEAVRGHDIAPLLVRELGIRNVWAQEEPFERAWRACIEASDLDECPLFAELRKRVADPERE